MARFLTVFVSLFTLAAACAPAATGDGLPVGGIDGGATGVESRAGDARYVTVPAGERTLALAIDPNGGEIRRHRSLRGDFTIPVVALDGSTAGLSADGRTLVLIKPRPGFPRATTTFAILDARPMRVREIVRLRGDFSYDAISPDGALVYLIQYTSRQDPTRYAVRGYDVRKGRLLPDPIIDPLAFGEGEMRGYPITRAMSPDGQWAYTLYDGAGGHPFVHALNTREMTAACIDLHALAGYKDPTGIRLRVAAGGGEIDVVSARGRVLAVIDAQTLKAGTPAAGASADGGFSLFPWLAGAMVVAVAALALVRRRRAPAPA